jgi:pyruvate formate lyase activating enzyme
MEPPFRLHVPERIGFWSLPWFRGRERIHYHEPSAQVRWTITQRRDYEALHDGPGIRTTVFLKGCPLSCLWCQNPEGISTKIELMYDEDKCIGCHECMRVCKQDVFSLKSGHLDLDRNKCNLCGACTENCYSSALRFSAKLMSIEEIAEQVMLDKEFYDLTGGGVTFSGGEPLRDVVLMGELFRECKTRNLNTAVETSLYVNFEKLESVLESIDYIMADFKIYDDKKHKQYTGVSNRLILSNLKQLSSSNKKIVIRTPIIPGVNDNEQELTQIQAYIESLNNVLYWELLPYHRFGEVKYSRLGAPLRSFGAGIDKNTICKLVKQNRVPIKY